MYVEALLLVTAMVQCSDQAKLKFCPDLAGQCSDPRCRGTRNSFACQGSDGAASIVNILTLNFLDIGMTV